MGYLLSIAPMPEPSLRLMRPWIFLPLTISRSKTPKLKTSDFTEKMPSMTYSGDIYPLDGKT
ncbi:hypothetical protein BDE02_01G380200 [Populus trichocarpa]|nr:hypothetical protein BDE02_01G380200 [Populus trichocarpa]